jgi:AraC family transcriptional regulator
LPPGLTARLLENAAALPDEALDRAIRPGLVVHEFEGPEPDVRTMLERVVFTKEVWTAAIGGRDMPPRGKNSIAALQARLAAVQPQFTALVRRIRDRNEWDDVFVDALCTPPVSFTLGSVIAHILTAGAVRCQTVIGALRELGVRDVESRDPIDWERAIATRP